MSENFQRILPDAEATDALGRELAPLLKPGSTVFLIGDLGAGKSSLARSIIHSLLGSNEPVPSPTFTITQHYETPAFRIVHADLYRLSGPDELEEIGLDFTSDVTLIEWPDRLEHLAPAERLEIRLSETEDGGRMAAFSGIGVAAEEIAVSASSKRDDLREQFLKQASWGNAQKSAVPGDASGRRYFRLSDGPENAVLMDAPYANGEDVRPFITVTSCLRERGLSAPKILSADEGKGFLLLEDLGESVFAPFCAASPDKELMLYEAAVDLLHQLDASHDDRVPDYDMTILLREAALLTDWWCPAAGVTVSRQMRADYLGIFAEILETIAETRSTLVLRDYHAENLIWLPQRQGHVRVGLLDYQDALLGHPAYDLVSLLEDARRDVPAELAESMIRRFSEFRSDLDASAFRADYDSLGAQRNAKIVGIFARLFRRDGKPRYLSMIPRVWSHLQRDLKAPHLAKLRDFIMTHVPEPTDTLLKRIAST